LIVAIYWVGKNNLPDKSKCGPGVLRAGPSRIPKVSCTECLEYTEKKLSSICQASAGLSILLGRPLCLACYDGDPVHTVIERR